MTNRVCRCCVLYPLKRNAAELHDCILCNQQESLLHENIVVYGCGVVENIACVLGTESGTTPPQGPGSARYKL